MPEYRKVIQASAKAQETRAEEMFLRLSDLKKAAALNILAKMNAVTVAGRTVLSHVSHIEKFYQDRIYVRLKKTSNLRTALRKRADQDQVPKRESAIVEAPSGMHPGFEEASYKTKETSGQGNLQLSFAEKPPDKGTLVDADIDIYTDVLGHLFGEVFVNHLTDTKTDPFTVYGVLKRAKIAPDYALRKA